MYFWKTKENKLSYKIQEELSRQMGSSVFVLKMTLIAGILRKNSQMLSGMHISIIYTFD